MTKIEFAARIGFLFNAAERRKHMYMDRFTAFTVTFANLERNLHKIKTYKMAAYGLRATHFMCMAQIYLNADGLTPTEIAKTCSIDKAFVSRITNDLTSHGFIKINEKFNDGRKYRQKYILSDKGIAVIEEVQAIVDKIINSIYQNVTDYEMRCFYKVLFTINDHITDAIAEMYEDKI